jgi:transposase
MTVPGIGPIIASAMVAAIGNGAAFTKGRDFAAWLGLVPKQIAWTVLATRAGTVERATIWSRVNSPADGVAERD